MGIGKNTGIAWDQDDNVCMRVRVLVRVHAGAHVCIKTDMNSIVVVQGIIELPLEGID